MRRGLLLAAVLVAGLVAAKFLLLRQMFVVSNAFAPTLRTGDTIMMSRLSYGASRHSFAALARWFPQRLWAALPQRGDVVVVKLPRDGQTDFVSRVIGLPGERVQMRAGRLYINNVLVERRQLPAFIVADRDGKPAEVAAYEESLPGGARHVVLEAEGDTGRLDTTVVFDVPAASYFLMGDNRDESVDSRLPEAYGLGFVPYENFVGRVLGIAYAFGRDPAVAGSSGMTASLRWNRVLRIVR